MRKNAYDREIFEVDELEALVIAQKVIPVNVNEKWNEKFEEIKTMKERKQQKQQLQIEFEYEMELIGITTIKDKLQVDAKDTFTC